MQPSNQTFALTVPTPFITTLFTAGHAGGDPLAGALHFPELAPASPCRNISTLPRTSLYDDLPQYNNSAIALFPVIAFAPWSPGCNKQFLDAARDERATLDAFLFYSPNHSLSIPPHDAAYWHGIHEKDYNFPIYAMRGLEGNLLMRRYTQYAEQKSVVTDIHNSTGRARIFIEVNTADGARLPGLWLFLLIVLGVLLAAVGLTSLSMHALQWWRRRSLRRRVASGQVDLEALGVRRVLVPQKALDLLPMRPYRPQLPGEGEGESEGGGYQQTTCTICLEDFAPDTATTVRQLPCHHVYHPPCIDPFLLQRSSLCPLCKRSVLPKGFVPQRLNNATVRRERVLRRLRERERERERNRNRRRPHHGGLGDWPQQLWSLFGGDRPGGGAAAAAGDSGNGHASASAGSARTTEREVEMRQPPSPPGMPMPPAPADPVPEAVSGSGALESDDEERGGRRWSPLPRPPSVRG